MNQGKFFADKIKAHGKAPADVPVGIPWYTETTYPQCLAIFSDADNLPSTYEEWLILAKETEQSLTDNGFIDVIRAEIDPVKFPRWCADHGYSDIDANARSAFGNMVAIEIASGGES